MPLQLTTSFRNYAGLALVATALLAGCRDLPEVASVHETAASTPPATGGQVAAASQCGNGVCDAGESCQTCANDCNLPDGNACPRVGILYSVWHVAPATAMLQLQQSGRTQLTMEDVLRSRVAATQGGSSNKTAHSMSEVLPVDLFNVGEGFFYQHHPARGFYCIYKKRQPGDLNYTPSHEGMYLANTSIDDCTNVDATLAEHAQQLAGAGVDHVVVDMVNFPDFDMFADGLGLRPLEVLTQGWNALRQQDIATPDIAAWIRLPAVGDTAAEGPMAPRVLALYNDPKLRGMFLKDRVTHKRVMFYIDSINPDPAMMASLQSNNGANDIVLVPLSRSPASGRYGTASGCEQGVQLGDAACKQAASPTGPLGSQISVSASYQSDAVTPQGEQIGFSGLPFGATGLYGGATLHKQFEGALAQQANYVLLSSWNEHVSQPIVAASATFTVPPSVPIVSMGLETDSAASNVSFFASYGAEFSRDMEPTVEGGDALYQIMSACVHLLKEGAQQCDDPNNLCCQGGKFSDSYAFFNGAVSFGMMSPSVAQRAGLLPMYLCNNLVQGTQRCSNAQGTAGLLGYASGTKGGGMLRTLLLCEPSMAGGLLGGGASYNTLTGSCNDNNAHATFVGYVR